MRRENLPFFLLIGAILVLIAGVSLGIWAVVFRGPQAEISGPVVILAEGDTLVISAVQASIVFWDDQAGGFIDLPLVLPEDLPPEKCAERIIEELLAQPWIFPEGTELRNLFVAEGTVYIDLTEAVRSEALGATGEWIIIESLARTLAVNLGEAAQKMVVLVEGREAPSLAGRLACRVELF